MKILVAGLVKNIQVQRLQEEALKKGHIVEGCFASDLVIHASPTAFEAVLKDGRDLLQYDLIYLIVGSRRWEWYVAAKWLEEIKGTKIVNHKVIDPTYFYALTPASEYKMQTEKGLPFPQSTVAFTATGLEQMLAKYTFPVIIKPTNGRQGRGVSKVNSVEEAQKSVEEILKTAPAFVIREFIPNDGDMRVFTVGYKAIAAMKRIPQVGEFRSNISIGGTGEIFDLEANPRVKEIAEELSELTKTEIAGVDIMINKETNEPYILEINPAPQFAGLEKFTGVNAAEKIIEYFERK